MKLKGLTRRLGHRPVCQPCTPVTLVVELGESWAPTPRKNLPRAVSCYIRLHLPCLISALSLPYSSCLGQHRVDLPQTFLWAHQHPERCTVSSHCSPQTSQIRACGLEGGSGFGALACCCAAELEQTLCGRVPCLHPIQHLCPILQPPRLPYMWHSLIGWGLSDGGAVPPPAALPALDCSQEVVFTPECVWRRYWPLRRYRKSLCGLLWWDSQQCQGPL